MQLDSQIEAILFFKGEAVSLKQLAVILDRQESDILTAINSLKEKLSGRGITLITKDDKVMLGTSPEMFGIIEGLRKDELSKDLGKASLETLSIVLYRGPVRKSEVDYIRGVNSGSILRNLLVRGLIEKIADDKSQRSYLYTPTFELLSFLGISDLSELPEYDKVKKELETVNEESQEEECGFEE